MRPSIPNDGLRATDIPRETARHQGLTFGAVGQALLYHMGLRLGTKRSTLADANETCDWRIHAEFAQRLIEQARKLHVGDSFGIELENTAYALDSTTIDLCLSLVRGRCFAPSSRCRQEAPQSGRFALYFVTDIFAHPVRENAHPASVTGQ